MIRYALTVNQSLSLLPEYQTERILAPYFLLLLQVSALSGLFGALLRTTREYLLNAERGMSKKQQRHCICISNSLLEGQFP